MRYVLYNLDGDGIFCVFVILVWILEGRYFKFGVVFKGCFFLIDFLVREFLVVGIWIFLIVVLRLFFGMFSLVVLVV